MGQLQGAPWSISLQLLVELWGTRAQRSSSNDSIVYLNLLPPEDPFSSINVD